MVINTNIVKIYLNEKHPPLKIAITSGAKKLQSGMGKSQVYNTLPTPAGGGQQ
jgi:hypothetical protein